MQKGIRYGRIQSHLQAWPHCRVLHPVHRWPTQTPRSWFTPNSLNRLLPLS
jgi:hypothetical protein